MEVLVKYESRFRFSAICKEYTITTVRGDDGNQEPDGMVIYDWGGTRNHPPFGSVGSYYYKTLAGIRLWALKKLLLQLPGFIRVTHVN